MNALQIRYANPDTTPLKHGPRAGWIKSDVVVTDDYWIVYGQDWALDAHLKAALAANDLNDYRWVEVQR